MSEKVIPVGQGHVWPLGEPLGDGLPCIKCGLVIPAAEIRKHGLVGSKDANTYCPKCCEHVWGSVTGKPHVDAAECIKCHVVWSCAEIARDGHYRLISGLEFERAEDEYLGRT